MKQLIAQLLATTAILAALGGAAVAQTDTGTSGSGTTTDAGATGADMADGDSFAPPEGYEGVDSGALTTQDLEGADVYDAEGESVGAIAAFVFGSATGGTGMDSSTAPGAASPGAPDTGNTTNSGSAVSEGTGETEAAPGGTGSADMGTADTSTADTGTADMGTGDAAATEGAMSGGTGAGEDGTSGSTDTGSDTGADTSATGMTDSAASDSPAEDSSATAPTAPSTTGSSTMDGTATDGAAMDGATTDGATGSAEAPTGTEVSPEGTISHVLVDVGGFLGLGARTVAIPFAELEVFQNEGGDLHIYLPWTEDELAAVPEYDEADPETLPAAAN